MTHATTLGTEPAQAARPNPKLRAALEYLGNRLTTHPASQFKPAKRPLLEEWLAARRGSLQGSYVRASGGYRTWLTKTALKDTTQ